MATDRSSPAAVEKLRRNIASRKRNDRIFFIGGLVLIVGALGILAALFINLVRDGMPALTQTFKVEPLSTGTGMNDLSGKIKPQGDQWLLQTREMTLDDVKDAKPLDEMIGKKVGIKGRMRGGLVPEVVFKSLTDPDPAKSPDVIGTLGRREQPSTDPSDDKPRTVYTLQPEPLLVGVSKVTEGKELLKDGATVVFKWDSRVKAGKFDAIGKVEPLIEGKAKTKTFFTSFPSKEPEKAGILSAWVGTLLIMVITLLATVPMGVAAGVYLEEYAPKNRWTSIVEINIANLAGVPSIIWGLMALGLFVYTFDLGRSILTAGLTLGLLVLPIVIIATREAIRAIPSTIREASIGLGATKWQTIRYHILPYSLPGVLTGSIIALSRAIGETAPLVTIGALTFIAFLPPGLSDAPPYVSGGFFTFQWIWSEFTVLPIQLFQWVSRPEKPFQHNAAAAGVVLLTMTLSLNAVAIYLRARLRRKIKW